MMVHKYQFNLLRDFQQMHKERPTISHLHLSESTHDSINMVKHYDNDLARMFGDLANSGVLNSTMFLLMGDHGFRAPIFAKTRLGKIENNMPGLLVLLPGQLARERPELAGNLRGNAGQLTSHWDVNMMLRHLLAISTGAGEEELGQGRGSLLLPLPERTCSQAEVLAFSLLSFPPSGASGLLLLHGGPGPPGPRPGETPGGRRPGRH
jgi:hypothetical protein